MDLILEQDSVSRPIHLDDGLHLVGRAADASVRIPNPAVSAHHARLRVEKDKLFITDLGSLNGTLLNGVPLQKSQGEVEVPPGAVLSLAGVILTRGTRPSPPCESTDGLTVQSVYQPQAGSDRVECRHIMESLSGLFELITGREHLLEDRACSFVAGIVPADRVVMLEDSGEGTSLEKVGSWTSSGELTEEIMLSRTIIDRVMHGRTSVLLKNVQDDGFGPSESMLLLHLISAMAVPLFDNQRVRGILYVDTTRPGTTYSEDDLQVVTATANAVAVRLRNRTMEHELSTAARIQHALLPSELPQVSGFQLQARLDMCRAVGGDLYHALDRNRATVLLAVGDVAGKGIPAALAMSAGMLMISTLAEISSSTDAIVNLIHRQLWENLSTEQFLTLFLAELDPATGSVTYINAGHEPPLVVRAAGGIEKLGPTGPPVALLPDSMWIMEQVTLEPGDLLAAFTDGIPEATTEGDRFMGQEPLVDILQSGRTEPLEKLSDAAFAAVRSFLGDNPPSDDVTLMLLRRNEA